MRRYLTRRVPQVLIVTLGIWGLAMVLGIAIGWPWFALAGVLTAVLDPL